MERVELAVIGAGASGLMAARRASLAMNRRGKAGGVVLLEGNPKAGKKLLATGNGRCNLTNMGISPEKYHGDSLAARVLEKYPARRILEEFAEMGLLCAADGEGRVYPRGGQSASVLDALRGGTFQPLYGQKVVSVSHCDGGFLLETADGNKLWAQKCVLACGGAASPAHSMGGGYELARQLGHTVTELSPSLVPIKTSSKVCGALKGMRVKARAALYKDGRPVYAESGEVIFGAGQLSGICIFNLSARLRETGLQNVEIGLDLLEDMEEPAVFKYLAKLRETRPDRGASELFFGLFNFRVGQELLVDCGISKAKSMADMTGGELRRAQVQLREHHRLPADGDKRVSELTDRDLEQAAKAAKDWRFPVTGAGPWEDAQITAGGVPLREVEPDTMESKKCPGLYLAGELLDVDGDCGGYNLHWAWATGLLAGDAAGRAAF